MGIEVKVVLWKLSRLLERVPQLHGLAGNLAHCRGRGIVGGLEMEDDCILIRDSHFEIWQTYV